MERDYLKIVRERYNFTPENVFNHAREIIEDIYLEKLSLIELVELKQYVVSALELLGKISLIEDEETYQINTITPWSEAIARFMNDNYGIDTSDKFIESFEYYSILRPSDEQISRESERLRPFLKETQEEHDKYSGVLKQYLGKRQEEYHMP